MPIDRGQHPTPKPFGKGNVGVTDRYGSQLDLNLIGKRRSQFDRFDL